MNQSCRVCGEVAAGYHFGAFTCEGCKSFFGRTYNNQSSIGECKNSKQCVINKKNRTSCKSCRLQKCISVGMSKSGSRYGRRSNWFKIHCLLQDQGIMQQQQQQHQNQQQQLINQDSNQPLQLQSPTAGDSPLALHAPNQASPSPIAAMPELRYAHQQSQQQHPHQHQQQHQHSSPSLTHQQAHSQLQHLNLNLSLSQQEQREQVLQLAASVNPFAALHHNHNQNQTGQLSPSEELRYAQHLQQQQPMGAAAAAAAALASAAAAANPRDSDAQVSNLYASAIAQFFAYCYLVSSQTSESGK